MRQFAAEESDATADAAVARRGDVGPLVHSIQAALEKKLNTVV
jgi:hypothetical protein